MAAASAGASGPARAAAGGARDLAHWLGFAGIAAEAALVAWAVASYHVESATFQRLMPLLVGGFVVHHLLPQAARLPFFTLLSVGATAWVLGIEEAQFHPLLALERTALLLAVGGALIAICRLPLRFAWRVALLVAAGAALAAARVATADHALVGALWPVLGAMFMFRTAVYLYDTEHDKNPPGVLRSLAYFFMFPNVCFTLFPVVDWKSFSRGHGAADALRTYQRGVQWMARGLVQILCWRLVYYHVHLDPSRVQDGADLVQFIVSNVLLYLRVSGSFHLIVGMLHLFGFALPMTNRRYFLAASFNDYWRRVNIYWKDFIMKVVYYPITFRLKAWGTAASVVVASAVAFAISWLLHSYQLFWLRGDFPIQSQEAVFWGSLGALVIANSLWEMRPGRRPAKRTLGVADRIAMSLRTAGTFTVITLLWSLWNTDSIPQWIALWSHADGRTAAFGAAVIATIAVLAYPFGGDAGTEPPLTAVRRKGAPPPTSADRIRELARVHAPVAALVAIVTLRSVVAPHLGPEMQVVLSSLSWTRPNTADGEREVLGYYDNAIEVSRFNRSLGDAMGGPPAHWQRMIEETDAARLTGRYPLTELVPSRQTLVNGQMLSANRFGMRDRDYEIAKPPGTFRIALVGSSGEMGWGVGDGETYEALLEGRLAREETPKTGLRYEVLNFGVNGWSAIEQAAAIRDRVAPFAPDVVIYGAHSGDRYFVMTRLAKGIRLGVAPPEPFLADLAQSAALDASTPEPWALRRLTPRTDTLLEFGYRRMVEETRRIGARPLWLWVPLPQGGAVDAQEATAMRALAERAGFTTLSLDGAYADTQPESLVVAPWDGHPNAKGHRMLADRAFEILAGPEGRQALGEPVAGAKP